MRASVFTACRCLCEPLPTTRRTRLARDHPCRAPRFLRRLSLRSAPRRSSWYSPADAKRFPCSARPCQSHHFPQPFPNRAREPSSRRRSPTTALTTVRIVPSRNRANRSPGRVSAWGNEGLLDIRQQVVEGRAEAWAVEAHSGALLTLTPPIPVAWPSTTQESRADARSLNFYRLAINEGLRLFELECPRSNLRCR